MTLIKTYRRDEDGTLRYREAWTDGVFWRHEGKVGTKGTRRNLAILSRTRPDKPTAAEYFRAFQEEASADGFAEIAEDDHGWAVLQVWTKSRDLGDPGNAWFLEEGADALNDHLGWLGVGHYDGYDVGGAPPATHGADGTVVNLFCRVVDIPSGVKALRSFARAHDLSSRCVIGSREPGEDSEYLLAWSPLRSVTTFAL